MKSYTNLEQSKKLAEILPLESSDIWWAERYAGRVENYEYIVEEKPVYYLSFTKPSEENYSQDIIKDIPCWSLAALLDIIPFEVSLNSFKDGNWNAMVQHDGKMIYDDNDNPVDACVAMMLKLHEQKLL